MMKLDLLTMVRALVPAVFVATDDPKKVTDWVRSLHRPHNYLIFTQQAGGGHFKPLEPRYYPPEEDPPEGPEALGDIVARVLKDDPRDEVHFFLVEEDPGRWLETHDGVKALQALQARSMEDDRQIRLFIFVGNKEQKCLPELQGRLPRICDDGPLPGGLAQTEEASNDDVPKEFRRTLDKFNITYTDEQIAELESLLKGLDGYQAIWVISGLTIIAAKHKHKATSNEPFRVENLKAEHFQSTMAEVIEALREQCGWPE